MNKRKKFIQQLEEAHQNGKRWNKYTSPSLIGKFKRMVFIPDLYLPYLFFRLGLYSNQEEINSELFWGRGIYLNLSDDPDAFFLHHLKYLNRFREYKLTKFFIKNLDSHDVFYDIGANYGFYTYLALDFCKEVHSFEPLPEVFKNLEKNLNGINKVILNNKAVFDKNGITNIYPFDGSAGSTINEEQLNFVAEEVPTPIGIETISLDRYTRNHSKPSVIKIDVEGAEESVIKGGEKFFQNSSPIISMEVFSKGEGGEISMRAVREIRKLGYKSYFINKNGKLRKAKKDLAQVVYQNNLDADNFIFKKN